MDSSLAMFSLCISSTSLFKSISLLPNCVRPSPETIEELTNCGARGELTLRVSFVFVLSCELSLLRSLTPKVMPPEAANCCANKLLLPAELLPLVDDDFCWNIGTCT